MRYHTAADNQFDVKTPRGRVHNFASLLRPSPESVSVSPPVVGRLGLELEEDPGHPPFELEGVAFRKSKPSRGEATGLCTIFWGWERQQATVATASRYVILMMLVDFGLACSLLLYCSS